LQIFIAYLTNGDCGSVMFGIPDYMLGLTVSVRSRGTDRSGCEVGSVKKNVLPWPTLLSAQMRPP
jgi:hypothetical protein